MSLPTHSSAKESASTEVSPSTELADTFERRLVGEYVIFAGKLAGMARREACTLIRDHGGVVVSDGLIDGSVCEPDRLATLVVIGDNQPDLGSALQVNNAAHQRVAKDVSAGRTQLLRESELWQRLGLVGDESSEHQAVQRLYTPAMLAELLNIPVAAVRRWHRRGTLIACRSVRRLPYFDFSEVAVARNLASLYNAGCSLAVIERKLAGLHRSMPEVSRPLSDPSVVVAGRQLILRRGDDLSEPGGQLLIDFDDPTEAEQAGEVTLSVADTLQFANTDPNEESSTLSTFEQLQLDALKWEDRGELSRAVETYRSLLMAAGPTAEFNFALGNLLYRMGDLPAARERFYAAIELDEEYVEARANLGCVLAENNELELAVAAFQGALAFHVDYADVHYHLANALDRLEKHDESALHWQNFLALAPESPWAEMARNRLGLAEDESLDCSESLT